MFPSLVLLHEFDNRHLLGIVVPAIPELFAEFMHVGLVVVVSVVVGPTLRVVEQIRIFLEERLLLLNFFLNW